MTEDTADIKSFLANQFLGVKSSTQDKDMDFVHSEVRRVNDYAEAAR